MKLSVVATTIFTLTLGFYTPKVTAAPIKTPKTFKEWCQQKASLPQETKRTVEALLNVAETRNCSQANQTLTNLTTLTYLELGGNKISDIKPLSNLTKLTYLDLRENQISDIKPLSNLTKLTYLELWGNKISDIKLCLI
ncbi:leucine-rich repeat domain-containing protein [Aphanizomenon flos-aquae]|uniref:leucine-rich repeat domain-containing protein n=1 Tax=Aphanizomenon flos-aquae TaxID=1176 RepID=UPI000A4FD042|nr:leucine-rich repeat domain-containing protein [Aphanizomenon flos-aquae]